MKFAPRDDRSAVSARRLTVALAAAALVPLLLYAGIPSWWTEQAVLLQHATADYAPVNQGQLKNIAKAAVAEMDAKLSGGAGEELHTLIESWSNPGPGVNDFAPLNLGQLKDVAQPFYDRLIQAGLVDYYPWVRSPNAADDFAVANIGQVKNLFSFEIPRANSVNNALGDRLTTTADRGSLALLSSAVWNWGGLMSTGSLFERNYPLRVRGLSGVSSVAGGHRHLVALDSDGKVWTWGENDMGQLGDGTNRTRATPAALADPSDIVSLKAGGRHTLALKRDGMVVAWGHNQYGQLGTGDLASSSSPVSVAGLDNVQKISAGNDRSFAIKSDGTVWIWGYDRYANAQQIFHTTPVRIPGLTDVADVTSGAQHIVAVKSDGTVWAWGANHNNQVGNGNPWWVFQETPFQVPNLSNIVKVASNGVHTLGLSGEGLVWAWGYNANGQLGDGTNQSRQGPVQVVGLTDVVAIAAAYSYSLAMKSDGTVWAWGEGAVGTLPGSDRHVPQQVVFGLNDTNQNGMDDRWEINYFGNPDQAANDDFDGDGISNLKEFLRGTDPRDFYNGVPPVIEIVSGNNQFGDPGKLLPKPLTVRIQSASGQLLVNAPVDFMISNGTGLITPKPGEDLRSQFKSRTDILGQASAYVMLPEAPGISIRVAASPAILNSSVRPGAVSFRASARFVPPSPPTPTPDPNATPTPTPTSTASPTATPLVPYRYAIIDLGKNLYPLRVNNKGVVLLVGLGPDGNWGSYRWKGGTLEPLTYSGDHSSLEAKDINDQDEVVGTFHRSAGPWKEQGPNELRGGLRWPANRSTADKIPAPGAFPGFGPYDWALTFQSASLTAISNKGEAFGTICTGSVSGFLYSTHFVMNSARLTAGANSFSQISNASATNDAANQFWSRWTGSSDTISRASVGHYIGRKLTPFPDNYLFYDYIPGDDSGMIDGEAVRFNPVDLNEAEIVVGNSVPSGSLVIRTPRPSPSPSATPVPGAPAYTETILEGGSPIAINDHVLPFLSPPAQSSPMPSPSPNPSPVPSPTPSPSPAPQILGWSGEAIVIWERQPDGETWHPFGLEEMIPTMNGWEYLEPYDMNDNGAIVGIAWYTDPSNPQAEGEAHAFLLVPVELVVDGNRDGEMSLDEASVQHLDRTTEERPYTFWINGDNDGAEGDPGDHVPVSSPDYADGIIRSTRDLEDLARLHVNVAGFEAALESASIKAAFEWKETTNNPRIKLYRARSAGTEYLTSEADAASALLSPLRDSSGEVVAGAPLFLPSGFWASTSFVSNIPRTLPVAWFLFEGSGEGKGQLVVSFWNDGRKIGEAPGVWLDLKDVKKMYQRANATPDSLPAPYGLTGNLFDDERVGYSSDVTTRFEPPPEEEEHCLIFVHGWKATEDDATSAGQTMFKRLWWEGYKGRFATFRWPTKTSATSYNTSEWLAWKYGKSLADYITKYIRQQIPSYRVSVAAHSMGNVVTAAALRRGIMLDKYLLMEAAIPAGCFNDSVNNYARFLTAEQDHQTPDTESEMGYRLFLASTKFNVGKFVSFFNIDDFALATGVTKLAGWPFETNWEKNQVDYKPDRVGGGQYLYLGSGASYYFTAPDHFRKILDVHESMAFVARPRSRAAGAELRNATVFGSVFNLQTSCNFGAAVDDHSGQFTRPIQQLRPFYQRMASELKQ